MEITSESSTPEPGVSGVNIDHFAARLSHLLIDTTANSRHSKRARTIGRGRVPFGDQHTGHDSVTGSKSMCLPRWSEREYTKGDSWAAHEDMTFCRDANMKSKRSLFTELVQLYVDSDPLMETNLLKRFWFFCK